MSSIDLGDRHAHSPHSPSPASSSSSSAARDPLPSSAGEGTNIHCAAPHLGARGHVDLSRRRRTRRLRRLGGAVRLVPPRPGVRASHPLAARPGLGGEASRTSLVAPVASCVAACEATLSPRLTTDPVPGRRSRSATASPTSRRSPRRRPRVRGPAEARRRCATRSWHRAPRPARGAPRAGPPQHR